MNKPYFFIFLMLLSANTFASDNPLLGKWSMKSEHGLLVIEFTENQMKMAGSLEMKDNVEITNVQYKKLDKSWGVELVSKDGKKLAAMMAIFESKDQIKFGEPGSLFFVLNRVKL